MSPEMSVPNGPPTTDGYLMGHCQPGQVVPMSNHD